MTAREKAKRIQRGNDALLTSYRVGKARDAQTDKELCALIGMPESTLARRKLDPGSFRLSELRALAIAQNWTAEECAAAFGCF